MSDPDEFKRDRPRLTYAHSLPLPTSHVEPLRRPHSLSAGQRPQLQRAKSWSQAVKKYIKHSTASFFGVDNDTEENDICLWNERHRRLANRCCGRLKEDIEPGVSTVDAATPSLQRGVRSVGRQWSEISSSQTTRPRIRRKDSVVKMTWDGVTFLTSSLARHRTRSRRRALMRSRSYAPASVADDSSFVAPTPPVPATSLYSEDSIVNEVFFDKPLNNAHSPITTVPSLRQSPPLLPSPSIIPSPSPSPPPPPPPPFPSPTPSFIANSSTSFPFYAPSTSQVFTRGVGWRPVGSGAVSSSPVGMRRIWRNLLDKALDNSDRRQYGIGLVGKLFGRRFRRERITSDVRIQLDDIDDHRPFFTYWVTTIQILIAVISLAVYGFGPIGFEQTQRSSLVLVPSLSLQQVEYFEPDNFWIGPRAADLIHLGAKFVPCMRKDKHVFAAIQKDRERERNTACCIRNDNSGCVQSSSADCSTTISTWRKWSNEDYGPGRRISGSVCGQDPSHCSDPPSIAPFDWPDDITKWPICKKKVSRELSCSILDHMTCELIGRPCCIGIFGECRITTREYCDFIKGFFHEEAFLCSQVSCLDDVCGMIPFYDPEYPDQVYRLWTSLFLHAGLIHLAITVVVQYFLMRDLEKLAGCVRIGAIYILSGVAGNLASAIFVPYRAEVGPAGSQFGLLACLFVEVLHSWPFLYSPGRALLKLSLIVFFLFLLGLLPWVDNYAHVIGFTFGFLLSYAILPFVSLGKYDRQRKIILIGVCFLLLIVLFSALVILFYVFPIYECDTCKYFNCIPLTRKMCDHQDINITRGEL